MIKYTRRQKQILQLMREGWEIHTTASVYSGGTAKLERKGNNPRRISWETAQRLVIARAIDPSFHDGRDTWYRLAQPES